MLLSAAGASGEAPLSAVGQSQRLGPVIDQSLLRAPSQRWCHGCILYYYISSATNFQGEDSHEALDSKFA
jgi:hypothetical protein